MATESDLRRRVCPERIESTKPDRTVRGTQKPAMATSEEPRMMIALGVVRMPFTPRRSKRASCSTHPDQLRDNDEPRVGLALKNIRKKCPCGLASGVRVDDIDLGFRRFEGTKIGSENGLQLLADDFEIRLEKCVRTHSTPEDVERAGKSTVSGSSAFGSHFAQGK